MGAAALQVEDDGIGRTVGIICGGGALPFAVADSAARQGRQVVLFPIRGWADRERTPRYRHHWMRLGQLGRFFRLAAAEGCGEIIFIGNIARPTLSEIGLDWQTLRLMPRIARLFRGGDDRLLSGLGQIFEERGFKLVGAHEVAPDILMPEGRVGRNSPSERDEADIACGFAALSALGPFDVGQAIVVADNRVLAIEAAEGTDLMLARIVELRRLGKIRIPVGMGVLVKAPKPGQDHRLDLPAIGPQTVAGVVRAGLAGMAVAAGKAIIAEPHLVAASADKGKVFVVGVDARSQ